MLGNIESFKETPLPVVKPAPVYLMKDVLVALTEPDRELTYGLPFCEVIEGIPQWMIGTQDPQYIYREIKASLHAMNLTYTHLNGRLIYRARPITRRRIPMAYSGLLVNRMKQLAADSAGDTFDPKLAIKLYQMLGDSGRAVLVDHLTNGPIINANYEMEGYQSGLVTIGLLTRCVIKGKTGLTVANELALRVYNAALDEKKDRTK